MTVYLKRLIDGVFIIHTTFSYHFSKLLQPWTCSECWVSNKSTDDKCIACGKAKQSNGKSVKLADIGAQNNTFTSVFGDRTFKPLSSSGGTVFSLFRDFRISIFR